MTTKKEIFNRFLKEYLKANKKRKGQILDNVCDTTNINRKSAIRKFKRLQLKDSSLPEKRGRPVFYTKDVICALKYVWEAASEVCGELLHPMTREYIDVLKRDGLWKHTEEATKKLLLMSEGTMKKRVGCFMKARRFRKGLSSTKPSHLKEIIPVFFGSWKDKGPGYGQIDTVVHCGYSLLGNMVYTLNYTDVCLFWVELRAQWNKGEEATKQSMGAIKKRLPFDLKEVHPDTGSEFINWNLKRWCDKNNVDMTRSRPGKKNDNAYVEQKNGHVVRRFVGYTRIDVEEAVPVLNEMYEKLSIYLNHFVASRKTLKKVRVGSKYIRKYEKAKTPYQRILECSDISEDIKDNLREVHKKLNPLILKKEIDKLIDKVFKIQKMTR